MASDLIKHISDASFEADVLVGFSVNVNHEIKPQWLALAETCGGFDGENFRLPADGVGTVPRQKVFGDLSLEVEMQI